MRYHQTAVHIYDVPRSTAPDLRWARWQKRLAMAVSAIGVVALLGLVAFVVFGIISQLW